MTDWLLPEACKDQKSITKDWHPSQQQLIDGVIVKEVRPVLTGYGHLTEIFRCEWLSDCKEVEQIFASTLQPRSISAWHAVDRAYQFPANSGHIPYQFPNLQLG